METAESIPSLYETLSPLSIPPPPPSSTSVDSESYVVLRNEISASILESTPIETAAVDFFSLDVDAEDDVAATPVPTLATPGKEVKENDRRLEGTWFRANCRFRSPMLQLHKEIVDFANFLSPTPEEEASRNEAIQSVCDVIRYIWPNCKVEIFGSFKTGLYLPTSDIDAVILDSNIKSPQHGLVALSRALSQKQIAKKIQVIGKARVPIIKFVEKKSSISFDVSFDMQNGPKAADFIKNAISQWPPLRPLCLILKIFLQQRELNEVYTGGIGSYALLVMIITTLQTYYKSGNSSEHNLGVLLVNFFDLYGCRLNTSDVGISCVGGGSFFSKIRRGFSSEGKQLLISIEDPQTTENDIGKSSFNYFMVKSAFSMAFRTLTNEKTIMGLGSKRSILGTIIRPDAALLERKGGSSRELTFKDLLPGAGDPLPQQQHGVDGNGLYCNWLIDGDDESLPRDNLFSRNDGLDSSSGKKRKKKNKEEKKSVKKAKKGDGASPSSSMKKTRKMLREKKRVKKLEKNMDRTVTIGKKSPSRKQRNRPSQGGGGGGGGWRNSGGFTW